MKVTVTVVLFYEHQEALDTVLEVITPQFDMVHEIDIHHEQHEFIKLLQQHHQCILYIYAIDNPKTAAELKHMLDNHPSLSALNHFPQQAFLICDKVHRELAFQFCMEESFYSYETMRPIYDVGKIRLALARLSNQLVIETELLISTQDKKSMADQICESHQALDTIINELNQQKQAQQSALDQLSAPIFDKLQEIPDQQWRNAFDVLLKHRPDQERQAAEKVLSGQFINPKVEAIKQKSSAVFDKISDAIEKAKPHITQEKETIVVADDQPVMLKILSTILQPNGFNVELASNGVEALLKAKVFYPKVVLLDIDMPIMNGFDTLSAIRKLPALEAVPVIMLTSHNDKQVFEKCLRNGASDYIIKPTNADTLLKKINHYL
ncbi:response regulator [Thaumasiovibrio subtropicus]|uniref:response regulator n=1 Tax=Thaumasiovibrio subtropicus TaxID=1891207 RepID=UPI000B352219|nr:response regulator [Thaumasiovibrio subtropicus]